MVQALVVNQVFFLSMTERQILGVYLIFNLWDSFPGTVDFWWSNSRGANVN